MLWLAHNWDNTCPDNIIVVQGVHLYNERQYIFTHQFQTVCSKHTCAHTLGYEVIKEILGTWYLSCCHCKLSSSLTHTCTCWFSCLPLDWQCLTVIKCLSVFIFDLTAQVNLQQPKTFTRSKTYHQQRECEYTNTHTHASWLTDCLRPEAYSRKDIITCAINRHRGAVLTGTFDVIPPDRSQGSWAELIQATRPCKDPLDWVSGSFFRWVVPALLKQ